MRDETRRAFIRRLSGAAAGAAALPWLVRELTDPVAGRRVREYYLRAQQAPWDVGDGRIVPAYTFNGTVPGPMLEFEVGQTARIVVDNALSEPITAHWHGLPVPFAMDGVPELTQEPIAPGERFVYEFPVDHAGTYWYHSHYAFQYERGLFGGIIVRPRREELAYDREYTILLDDWLHQPDDPVFAEAYHNFVLGGKVLGSRDFTTDSVRYRLNGFPGVAAKGPSLARMRRQADSLAAARAGHHGGGHGLPIMEPVFDAFTVNGRVARANPPLVFREGERIRLRFINVGTAAVFPIYLSGHRMTITHTDGQPVSPKTVEVLSVGMGERFDVIVEADQPGVWRLGSMEPLYRDRGFGIDVRYHGVRGTEAVDRPPPLESYEWRPYDGLVGIEPRTPQPVDREYDLLFEMGHNGFLWGISGQIYPAGKPLEVKRGERVRLSIRNGTVVGHPVHFHGHFFDLVRPYGATEDLRAPLRKDTLTLHNVDRHVLEFVADNPGPRWMLHCHNQYHHVAGMALEVKYV